MTIQQTYRCAGLLLSAATMLCLSGCRQDMQDQPKYKPLAASRFFSDGRASRPIPNDTVAQDELNDDDPAHTGSLNGAFLQQLPMPVDKGMLLRGEQRFNIFCSPCHGRTGDGHGMVAQRGVKYPANLHTDRLRSAPPGYMFQVISNGYGAMMSYGQQIDVEDRWAIVAYIHALQLSQNATMNDVPADQRTALEKQP